MKLIDSSSWIHALRKNGDSIVRDRVQNLLFEDSVAWCDIVRVELWRGVSTKKEELFLKSLEESITLLPIDKRVWDYACTLGQKTRLIGKPVPATDIIIVACARIHAVEVEHCDAHIEMLLKLSSSITKT